MPGVVRNVCVTAPTWVKDPTAVLSKWVTSTLGSRENEIETFVKDYGIEKYVVIDDWQLTCPNFVQCSAEDGVTHDVYQKCKPFLADKPEDVTYEQIFI